MRFRATSTHGPARDFPTRLSMERVRGQDDHESCGEAEREDLTESSKLAYVTI